MGVYIKNLKIPPSGACVFALTSSGMVENVNGLVVGEAVEVKEPHGDLIDRSKLEHDMEFVTSDETCPLHIAAEIDQYIAQTPTVIKAEGNDGNT